MTSDFPRVTLPAGHRFAFVLDADVERWDREHATDCLRTVLEEGLDADAVRELARRLGLDQLADDLAVARCVAEAIADGRVLPVGLAPASSGGWPVFRSGERPQEWSRAVPLSDLRGPTTGLVAWVSFAVLDRRGRPFAGAQVRVSGADGDRTTIGLDGYGRHVAVGVAKNTRLRVELPAMSELPKPQPDAAAIAAMPGDVELRGRPGQTIQLGPPKQHYRIVIAEPPPGFSA